MATELHWPRRATFLEGASDGSEDNTEERRYVGPGTFEVPDEMVETYLDRGWERPDQDGSTEEAPPAASQDESEPDADEAEAEGFDSEAFVDDSWQAVKAAIEDGEADGHLDDVREAEENRDGDSRSSVIEALEQRAR